MKVVKQPVTLKVDNHDIITTQSAPQKHGPLLPSTVRCLIVGPSNCGKTNLMLSLLEHPNGLKFEHVYLWTKSLLQPKYLYLRKLLEPIKGVGYHPFSSSELIMEPSQARANSIFIFDDVACDNQDVIREYFSMGRHNCIDCFYLCQSYARIPKHLIRDNANVLIVFKQDDQNLRHIYSDHIGADMSFEDFKSMCALCWKEQYGFLSILKDSNINNGRYRQGLDHYVYLNNEV